MFHEESLDMKALKSAVQQFSCTSFYSDLVLCQVNPLPHNATFLRSKDI